MNNYCSMTSVIAELVNRRGSNVGKQLEKEKCRDHTEGQAGVIASIRNLSNSII